MLALPNGEPPAQDVQLEDGMPSKMSEGAGPGHKDKKRGNNLSCGCRQAHLGKQAHDDEEKESQRQALGAHPLVGKETQIVRLSQEVGWSGERRGP